MNVKKKRVISLSVFLVTLWILVGVVCASAAERVNLEYWMGTKARPIFEVQQKIINEFEVQYPNVSVTFQEIPWGQYDEKLGLSIRSGLAPDVWQDGYMRGPRWIAMEGTMDLTDQIAEVEWGDKLTPLVDLTTKDGRIMGIPYLADVLFFGYNKELFRNVGVDPDFHPETWNQLLNLAEKLTADTNNDGTLDQWGTAVFGARYSSHLWTVFFTQAGGKIQSGGKFVMDEYVDEAITTMRFYKDLGEYSPGGAEAAAGRGYDEMYKLFLAQEVGIVQFYPGHWSRYTEWGFPMEQMGLFICPKGPDNNKTLIAGEALYIYERGKHKKEAWDLVKWMMTYEQYKEFVITANYIPTRMDLAEDKDLQKIPAMATGLEQLKSGDMKPSLVTWSELRHKLWDELAATLLGQKTIEQGVEDMFRDMRQIQTEWEKI